MGRYKSVTMKEMAERRFPHRVDIPVPPGGLRQRLNDMLDWCRENAGPEGWDEHGHREGLADYARFYFLDGELAAAFERRWLPNSTSGRER